MREKGREAYRFLTEHYSCTFSPVLKASYSQEVLYTCMDVHIATAHLHFFPALLPVTTAVQKYDSQTSLTPPFLQIFCGKIW